MVGRPGSHDDGGARKEPTGTRVLVEEPLEGRRGDVNVAFGGAGRFRARGRPVTSRRWRRRMRRTRLRAARWTPRTSHGTASPPSHGGSSLGSEGPTQTDDDQTSNCRDSERDIEKDAPRDGTRPLAVSAGVVAATGLATLLIASFGAGLAASVPFAAKTVLVAAGGVSLLTSPPTWLSERRSAQEYALRKRLDDTKSSARDLKVTIKLLNLEKEGLELEVESIKDSYKSLEELIKGTNAGSIDKFLPLVRKNQYVLGQMKEYLKERFLQDATKMALQSDVDNDVKAIKRKNKSRTCIVSDSSPFTQYVIKIAVGSIKLYAINIAVMKAITQLPFVPFFFAFSSLAMLQISALTSGDDAEMEGSNDRHPAKSS